MNIQTAASSMKWRRGAMAAAAGCLIYIIMTSKINQTIHHVKQRYGYTGLVTLEDNESPQEQGQTRKAPQAMELQDYMTSEDDFFDPTHMNGNSSIFRKFDATCSMNNTFTLSGMLLFNDTTRQVSSNVTTCLIHSFYPVLEAEAKKRMLNPSVNQTERCTRSPAITWYRDHVILVARITRCHKHKGGGEKGPNVFRRDYLYTQTLDSALRPINNGSFLPLVVPLYEKWMGGYLDGPQDPRPFSLHGRPYFVFHAAYVSHSGVNTIYPAIWNHLQNTPVLITITEDLGRKDKLNIQKNWMPLVIQEKLYFVMNLDPLSVLLCDIEGSCEYVINQPRQDFVQHKTYIRGGTNFVLYQWPFYIGVAHSVKYQNKSTKRNYFSNVIVIRATDFAIVYVSANIILNANIYSGHPHPQWAIPDPFFFPVTCLLESADVVAIGGHINDRTNIVIRLAGVASLMNEIRAHIGNLTSEHFEGGTLQDVVLKLITD